MIFIRSNPKESHRPCEGIRIALGLAASDHHLDLIFCSDAPILLTEAVEDAIDSELAKQYLLNLKSFVSTFYIEKSTETRAFDGDYPTTFLSRNEISKKIMSAASVMLF
ncbi:MAG: hypothetical protein AAB317_00140 [Nitrospirota bacterium]